MIDLIWLLSDRAELGSYLETVLVTGDHLRGQAKIRSVALVRLVVVDRGRGGDKEAALYGLCALGISLQWLEKMLTCKHAAIDFLLVLLELLGEKGVVLSDQRVVEWVKASLTGFQKAGLRLAYGDWTPILKLSKVFCHVLLIPTLPIQRVPHQPGLNILHPGRREVSTVHFVILSWKGSLGLDDQANVTLQHRVGWSHSALPCPCRASRTSNEHFAPTRMLLHPLL